MTKHQWDWDRFVQPLTYAYNAQIYRSTNIAPFGLVPYLLPIGPPTVSEPISLPSNLSNPLSATRLFTLLISYINSMNSTTTANIYKSQSRYKADYNYRMQPHKEIQNFQFVLVERAPNTTLSPADRMAGDFLSKLLPKATGPYVVKVVG